MYYDLYKGVYFVEGMPTGAKLVKPICTRLDGSLFSQSQLKSLDDVKNAMIKEVALSRGNAVVNFKYCQKSSFWSALFSIDGVRWEASGVIAIINPKQLN